MDRGSQGQSLGEASGLFLAALPPEERGRSQQEVYKFVRWYGWERPFTGITAPEVDNYAKWLSSSDVDYRKRLELVRAFLIYAKKEGWTRSNLAVHLKAKTGRTRLKTVGRHGLPEPISISQERYNELKAELAALKSKRSQVIDEMRLAAADKDFRENAPLDAAKEQRSQIEGRIIELEETLKSAAIIGAKREAILKASIGDSVVLLDLVSGDELRYKIVSRTDVDPTKGKISNASPMGKAIIGRHQGDMVEVTTPAGTLRYKIKQVER